MSLDLAPRWIRQKQFQLLADGHWDKRSEGHATKIELLSLQNAGIQEEGFGMRHHGNLRDLSKLPRCRQPSIASNYVRLNVEFILVLALIAKATAEGDTDPLSAP